MGKARSMRRKIKRTKEGAKTIKVSPGIYLTLHKMSKLSGVSIQKVADDMIAIGIQKVVTDEREKGTLVKIPDMRREGKSISDQLRDGGRLIVPPTKNR